MKQLFDALKSARKIEILVIAAMLCTLLVLCLNDDTAQSDPLSADEKRMQSILSAIEGAGRVSVMIATDESGADMGVVVTAEGADNVRTMLELQRAVKTLTGLELDKIEIVKSKG